MDHFHTRTHKLKGNISPDIQENIKYTTQIMQDCNDLVQKQFKIGIDHEISIYIVYMDGLVNTEMLQESVIRPLLQDSFPQERTAISQYVIESADWKWIKYNGRCYDSGFIWKYGFISGWRSKGYLIFQQIIPDKRGTECGSGSGDRWSQG